MAPEWVWHLHEEGPPPMALGDRLRQLRKEAGWSQADLGGKIGTDSQRVSRYETGKITPLPSSLSPGNYGLGLGSPAVPVWLFAPCSSYGLGGAAPGTAGA